ncbi:MAG: DUF481 domain-containing protein [Blastocatellia bacterium]
MMNLYKSLILTFIILLVSLSALNFSAAAQTPATGNTEIINLTLSNSDRISGRFIEISSEQIIIENSYAGRVSIRIAEIKDWHAGSAELRDRLADALPPKDSRLFLDAREAVKEAAEAKKEEPKAEARPAAAPTPAPKEAAKEAPWERAVDFAWTMARGNSNLSDVNAAFRLSRKRGSHNFVFNSLARYGVSNGQQSASLLSSSLRYERTVAKLPTFTESLFEIDRIKNLDYRLSENVGVSYPMLRGDDTQLSFDFGTGFTREDYENGVEKTTASGLLRLKARQKLPGKTQLVQQATIFSDLMEPGAYRIQAEASMTTPITKSIALRVSGINRFDARPQGLAKPNDFTLLTGFTFKF